MYAIQRAEPEQQSAVAELLKSVFGTGLTPSLLSPELLQWKVFSPRPRTTGSRSYVLVGNGEIKAHVCEWPLSFLTPTGEVQSCHPIDWAVRRGAVGTGVRVFQHLMAQNETVLTIGGSEQGRSLLPKLGFLPRGTLDSFACVVRPWRQYRARTHSTGWRDIARLARNTVWSFRLPSVSQSKWTATPVSDAGHLPDNAYRVPASSFCLGVRSASLLRYLLACPAMNCSLYALAKANTPRGYFMLNQVAGQCRIIDLAVDSEAPRDWEDAYRAAVSVAARQKETCEIAGVSSLPWLSDALRRIGFRLRKRSEVTLYDPAGRLVNAPPLHLRMTDNDECFLHTGSHSFLT
jgi:hypothetical protein